MSLYASGANYLDGIIEYDFFYEPWTFHYMTSSLAPESFDCVRDRFLGSYHTETDPEAVINGKCSGSSELGGNVCGALHKRFLLKPGQRERFIFMVGVADRYAGQAMRNKYSNLSTVDTAFSELRDYWQRKLDV